MRTENALPAWVLEAAKLPVAFAQVREDPQLDAEVLSAYGSDARVMLIASGGCTLAYLVARCRMARVDVVDPNPAQIALARLKLHLLRTCDKDDRLALLGHLAMSPDSREAKLQMTLDSIGVASEGIGPASVWADEGPDHAGRYERVFAQLRKELVSFKGELERLLSLSDPAEQARRVDVTGHLSQVLNDAFERTMTLPILVHLFGEAATRNRVEPFSRHFAHRTRQALATLPASNNPYLWQVLAGRYPALIEAPWIRERPPGSLPEITWNNTVMDEALAREPGAYDFIHLSNILDWLSPEEARSTLDLTHAALRRGGRTLIRQLNSTLDIEDLNRHFIWEPSQTLHYKDRSYFYRRLYLGRKR